MLEGLYLASKSNFYVLQIFRDEPQMHLFRGEITMEIHFKK